MNDVTCYRCGFNHASDVGCGDARADRLANLADQARAAVAEAKQHLCSHGLRVEACKQPHDRPAADAGLPEEAAT